MPSPPPFLLTPGAAAYGHLFNNCTIQLFFSKPVTQHLCYKQYICCKFFTTIYCSTVNQKQLSEHCLLLNIYCHITILLIIQAQC